MKSVLNFFFARSHSLAYALVIALQVTITALTGMMLIPLLAAVVGCAFVSFIEEANIEVQKKERK